MKSMFNIACSMVSLDVVFVSFFSFTRHPFSFNHFEVVEEADAFEESLVILEKLLSSKALLLLYHSRAKNVVFLCMFSRDDDCAAELHFASLFFPRAQKRHHLTQRHKEYYL
jgi:hypothetical protein